METLYISTFYNHYIFKNSFGAWTKNLICIFTPLIANNKAKRGVKMQNDEYKTEKSGYSAGKTFVKSVVWTLAALGLIAIGFYGADLLFG